MSDKSSLLFGLITKGLFLFLDYEAKERNRNMYTFIKVVDNLSIISSKMYLCVLQNFQIIPKNLPTFLHKLWYNNYFNVVAVKQNGGTVLGTEVVIILDLSSLYRWIHSLWCNHRINEAGDCRILHFHPCFKLTNQQICLYKLGRAKLQALCKPWHNAISLVHSCTLHGCQICIRKADEARTQRDATGHCPFVIKQCPYL